MELALKSREKVTSCSLEFVVHEIDGACAEFKGVGSLFVFEGADFPFCLGSGLAHERHSALGAEAKIARDRAQLGTTR